MILNELHFYWSLAGTDIGIFFQKMLEQILKVYLIYKNIVVPVPTCIYTAGSSKL